MTSIRRSFARFAGLFERRSAESEFDLEMESHLAHHVDDLVRRGHSVKDARRLALIALGGAEQTREIHRDQRRPRMLENFVGDLGYGLRGLRKSPAFTIAAIVILGLGIGVNTAIFTVVNAVVLKALPFPDPDRVMRLWHTPPASFVGQTIFTISPANFVDWKEQSRSFESMAAFRQGRRILVGDGEPQSVVTGRASAALFPILGLKPVIGQGFTTTDDADNGQKTAILTESFWRARFGADPKVMGRTLRLDGETVTVIGVMEDAGALFDRTQIWTPLAWNAEERAVRGNHNYSAVAKLKAGVSVEQAQSDLSTLSHRLEAQYPADNKDWGALVRPLQEDLVGNARSSLLLLLAAVTLVLLIACANLANLLLVRTHGRAREIAVRTALGAGRSRVVVQLLTEGLLLGAGGGAAGLIGALLGVRALVAAFGNALPRASEVNADATVLVFTIVLASLAGLLASAAPAWRLANRSSAEILKGSGRANSAAGDGRVRNLLVASEVALALMLLVGAGLLMKSLAGLRSVDPGFDPRSALTMSLDISTQKHMDGGGFYPFLRGLLDRVESVPGVEAVSAIDSLPFRGGSSQPVSTESTAAVPQSELPAFAVRFALPDYFGVARIAKTSGRDFNEADATSGHLVAVIGESTAARLFPNRNALGQRITLPLMSDEPREIVGVVRDVKMGGLDEKEVEPAIYLPASQVAFAKLTRNVRLTLIARTTVQPESVSRAVVARIRELDSELLAQNIMSLSDVVEESLGQRPLAMRLLGAFAVLALVLATIGIYSVIAYSVGQQMREIGIRLALGAPARVVLRMIVSQGLKPTLAGIAIGAILSAALVRFLSSQLYAVSAYDPATFVSVALIVVVTGIAATLIPAYRATRVDPMVTLRAES